MFRLAIYYTPPSHSRLARAAARWFSQPQLPIWNGSPSVPLPPAIRRQLTASPRHYGFHATIKPPFSLASSATVSEVEERLTAFCRSRLPFTLPNLAVTRLADFYCLRPEGDCPQLNELATATVMEFDDFRWPAGEAELARRRKPGMSRRQQALLERWGYPYVLEEFRFHLTLTGPLQDPRLHDQLSQLLPLLFPAEVCCNLPVHGLTLLQEVDGRPFTRIGFFPFGPAPG